MDTYMVIVILYSTLSLADSQGTTCEDAWVPFQGSCYFFGYEAGMAYTDAMRFCQIHNSNLVHVNDVHENNFLKGYMKRLKPYDYWLGLSDSIIEGDWRWSATDEIPTFTDWYPGQPESAGHRLNEDCADFIPGFDFRWGDHTCDHKFQPLCEKRSGDFEVVG